ncbi:MAG TPA: glycosyltransferase family 2 protein [Terriglobales bacterium]|nr:glycosyltransferase family 2 protein [Terriglobales bacterium]
MNAPMITIVTPSFQQVDFIEECLESVRSQGYRNLEHLVFDGGSTDGTVELLQRLSETPGWKHLRWVSEPDQGQSDALNKGFRQARGEIIGWLNSDDRYRQGAFHAVSAAFKESPSVDLFYGDYTWIDEAGKLLRLRREIEFNRFVLLYHRILWIPTTSSFFRRKIFEDGNLLDISLQYAMDYEFFVRLSEKGYRIRHLPKVLADFRFQPNSKTCKTATRQFEERDLIIPHYSRVLRNAGSLQMPLLQAFRAAAALRRWSEKLVRGYYFQGNRLPVEGG